MADLDTEIKALFQVEIDQWVLGILRPSDAVGMVGKRNKVPETQTIDTL